MDYKEYKEYINTLTREELINECLKLKASYDKSGISWLKQESLRVAAINGFYELQEISNRKLTELEKAYANIAQRYNNTVGERTEYYNQLEEKLKRDLQGEEN